MSERSELIPCTNVTLFDTTIVVQLLETLPFQQLPFKLHLVDHPTALATHCRYSSKVEKGRRAHALGSTVEKGLSAHSSSPMVERGWSTHACSGWSNG